MSLAGLVVAVNALAAEPDLAQARQWLQTGRYEECKAEARRALAKADTDEARLLLVRALLATGRYPEAVVVATNGLTEDSRSLQRRWLAYEALLATGRTEAAAKMVDAISTLAVTRPSVLRDPLDLIVLGRTALLSGADPKIIMDRLFEAARRADPKRSEVYLASGNLALEKHDYALAAKRFQQGLEQQPEDPDLHHGLAQAYAPDKQGLMLASLQAALERNSNHVGSLLLLTDHAIDAEDLPGAGKLLDRVAEINPFRAELWAYRALLAELQNREQAAQALRTNAFVFRKANPAVDHLIGRKLSQKYRFAEGAAHQRQALQMDSRYLPAMAQLAQDLLRLGDEAEGWRLIEEVHQKDAYDVAAYNLVTLRETMAKFATLTNEAFVLRMNAHEAATYGPRALALLGKARATLGAKYWIEPRKPCVVEVFPEQKDFAVRTFGMPDNPGFLGVCFGSVVTANSPAAQQAGPVNWEAVLWHELCHVITLQLTRNRMPRWLSEGISVYEERQANPAWGQHMVPRYREMILKDELTPIAKLSGAFLAPKSPLDLQFAYYESSLVVEFLVERFGQAKLAAVLRELGEGTTIDLALANQTLPEAALEKEFAAYARKQAEGMAPGLTWDKPPADGLAPDDPAWMLWSASRPKNFYVMMREAQQRAEQKRWPEAKAVLEKLVELYPGFTGPDSAYRQLAAAHRALGDTPAEQKVLTRFAELDKEAPDAYLRLMELGAAAGDWGTVTENVERYLAVNPLVAPPYRFQAQAAEAQGKLPEAVDACRILLGLDPPNPAEVHFTLARLLHRSGDEAARRHLLQGLEEVPRNRAGLRLLLELEAAAPAARNRSEATPGAKP